MDKFTLERDTAALLIVDIQDRLADVMKQRDKVIGNTLHLIELAKMIDIPIILTEQYPKGLGQTVAKIREALPEYSPLEKVAFNCCGAAGFLDEVERTGRNKIVIAGMETHICVLQTTLGLLDADYTVHVVADGVCSREKENWQVGLNFVQNAGAVVTGTETVLFQLLGQAGTEEFRAISKMIK